MAFCEGSSNQQDTAYVWYFGGFLGEFRIVWLYQSKCPKIFPGLALAFSVKVGLFSIICWYLDCQHKYDKLSWYNQYLFEFGEQGSACYIDYAPSKHGQEVAVISQVIMLIFGQYAECHIFHGQTQPYKTYTYIKLDHRF